MNKYPSILMTEYGWDCIQNTTWWDMVNHDNHDYTQFSNRTAFAYWTGDKVVDQVRNRLRYVLSHEDTNDSKLVY